MMGSGWQLLALLAAVVTAGLSFAFGERLWEWLLAHLPDELPSALWRWPTGLDHALAALCVALAAWPAWAVWDKLTPRRAPTGPDYENYVSSALAFETGRWALYYDDRYPGFPWLVSVVADGPVDVLRAGTELSMALTVLAAAPLYWIGRLLGGRAAGVVGALLGTRLAVSLDVGHSFTHYPLTATLDLSLLALGLGALYARSLPRAATAVGAMVALATLAIASDPKQLPLALGLVGAAGLAVAALGPGSLPARLPLAAAGLLPLPIAHALVARYHLGLLSLEALTIRTPLRFTDREALKAVMAEGWALGGEQAWSRLPLSFQRVAANVLPKVESGPDPAFLEAIPRVFPETSIAWASALILMPLLWLWLGRGSLPRRASALALVVIFAASAASPVRVHYAHRYALPYFQATPAVAAASLSMLLGGPGTLAAGGVALLVGPYSHVDTSFLQRTSNQGDIWIGYEKAQDLAAVDWALETLPSSAGFFDFGERLAMPALAAGFHYERCTLSPSWCAEEMAANPGPVYAVLRVNDKVSAEVPGGDRQRLQADRYGRLPDMIGACWRRDFMPGPGIAFYRWTCEPAPSRSGGPSTRPPTHDGATPSPSSPQ